MGCGLPFFQFLHRIPQVMIVLNERYRDPEPFNSFTGFHRCSSIAKRGATHDFFQFLHRIPLYSGGAKAGRDPTFQFLHRIPLDQLDSPLQPLSCSFNSFTGFHRGSSKSSVVAVGFFQFLHRIPLSPKVFPTCSNMFTFQFLHRIPRELLQIPLPQRPTVHFQFLHRIPLEASPSAKLPRETT